MAEPSKPLLEALAHVEHERWSDWMRHQFSRGIVQHAGAITLSFADVERWTRQMITPYADLTEAEKESDRREVRRYWEVVEGAGEMPVNETLVAAMKEAINAVKNPIKGDMTPACNYATKVLEDALRDAGLKPSEG